MAVKTFVAGTPATASDVNQYLANAGLVYVTSATVGSGVSSVTVSSAFNSTYDRYLIQVSNTQSSASAPNLVMALTGISTATQYSSFMFQLATSATVSTANVSANANFYVGNLGNQSSFVIIDGLNPNSTAGKSATFRYACYDNTSSYGGTGSLWSTSATTTTGFTLSPSSGTLTGGTITVMGYRKA